ncbi:MAG: amidase family protein [Lachnospiraceae bacterium]|nr:amidase family protein [Lachnospiraceae bacterium]
MLEAGETTSEKLVWAYLEHIAAEDTAGIRLKSVREFNPDAFAIARERDWERAHGKIRGALHGIPIMLKDSIDTGDKMHTTCGSVALKDHYAESDAFIVKRLREAGAIILGKNNLSEYYGFVSMSSPNCYSGIINGSPINPFSKEDKKLKPGGSSGGSAVSVAADFTAASIGTDTAGSIFEPACFNGVVGYKPTVGLVSRTGVLPVLMCQDVPGPITRCVKDAAIIADVIIARDEDDPDTFRAEEIRQSTKTATVDTTKKSLDLGAVADALTEISPNVQMGIKLTDGLDDAELSGKRIGIVRTGYMSAAGGMIRDEIEVLEAAVNKLEEAGANIIDVEGFLHAEALEVPEKHTERLNDVVMCDGFKVRLNHYLAKQKDLPFKSLAELIAWNKAHPEAIPIGQDYLEYVENRENPIMNMAFVDARANDLDICGERGIWGAFDRYEIDALILPGVTAQGIPATAGNPIISIPCGISESGAPVGLNLVGRIMDDHELLKIAAACERVLPKRPIPEV